MPRPLTYYLPPPVGYGQGKVKDIQRLRNLTTDKLHTEMEHVYEDLETITGAPGIMTHMLPRVCTAVKPWLKQHVPDARFWDSGYGPTHTGDFPLPVPTAAERKEMFTIFGNLPNPLLGFLTTKEGEK